MDASVVGSAPSADSAHRQPRLRHGDAAGWKHWTVVLPDGVLGQMNMRRWIETYAAQGINAHPFQEPRAALDWLIAQGE
jgi:hypothetical protein